MFRDKRIIIIPIPLPSKGDQVVSISLRAALSSFPLRLSRSFARSESFYTRPRCANGFLSHILVLDLLLLPLLQCLSCCVMAYTSVSSSSSSLVESESMISVFYCSPRVWARSRYSSSLKATPNAQTVNGVVSLNSAFSFGLAGRYINQNAKALFGFSHPACALDQNRLLLLLLSVSLFGLAPLSYIQFSKYKTPPKKSSRLDIFSLLPTQHILDLSQPFLVS